MVRTRQRDPVCHPAHRRLGGVGKHGCGPGGLRGDDRRGARGEARWRIWLFRAVFARGVLLPVLPRLPARPVCATTSGRTVRSRRTGWRFSETTLRSDPASSPRVYATATARRESRHPNRSRYSIPSKRRGRYGNAPRAITREVSHTALALRPVGGEFGWLAANSFAIFEQAAERSMVVGVLALRPERSAQVRMPPTASRASRGERPGRTGF